MKEVKKKKEQQKLGQREQRKKGDAVIWTELQLWREDGNRRVDWWFGVRERLDIDGWSLKVKGRLSVGVLQTSAPDLTRISSEG